ncbi:MAG: HD domain-containing protein [Methanomassiliicoccales archaeon]|nr:MAG: HD domain-containing protein [Methanomassiliicoccales archaeon]
MAICVEPTHKGNERLCKVVDRMNSDIEIRTLWRASNITAIDRLGYNDHGPTHIRIVTKTALKMLDLLIEAGMQPSVVKDYKLTEQDAEVIVVLAAALHDIGHAVHRDKHEEYSISMAPQIIRRLLEGIYDEEKAAIMMAEILHAIIAHREDVLPLTLEAGVVRVADALDMEKGRARIPFQAGKVNIHSVSALAIDKVRVKKGTERPILVEIEMSNSAGIFQIDELLRDKVEKSGIRDKITIVVHVPKEEKRIIERLEL